MSKQAETLRALLGNVPVIPVLVVDDVEHALPLARALVAGGLPVLEVTLRTAVALEAIERMASVPGAVVGAGTVLSPADLDAARRAGARFAVSPGLEPALSEAAAASDIPLLPGVMTPSEAMAARARGFTFLKLFPAAVAGGVGFLKALGGPLPDLIFCPTGGIGADTFRDYLALSNVHCVGGSWVAPASVLRDGDWGRVTELARETRS